MEETAASRSRAAGRGVVGSRWRPAWRWRRRWPTRSPPPSRAPANPLVVTSYLGRDPAAVAALTELCELAAIGVIESVPMRMNFPADHPLHLGYQWNHPGQNPVLAEADVMLVRGQRRAVDPGRTTGPARGARIYVIDVGPDQGADAAVARPGRPVRPGPTWPPRCGS